MVFLLLLSLFTYGVGGRFSIDTAMSRRLLSLEILGDIGIHPVPQELSISNVSKGLMLVMVFLVYLMLEAQMTAWWYILFMIPESTMCTVKDSMVDVFWTLLIYLINKRKIKIVVSGVNLKDAEVHEALKNCVVVSNHKSLFDYMLLYYLKTLVEKATMERISLSFFTWNSLWKGPSLKLLWNVFNNDENWQMSPMDLERELTTLKRQRSCGVNSWIAHFPEVNIVTDRSLSLQNQQLEKHYLPQFNNLLYPRFNNFTNLIKSIGKGVSYSYLKTFVGITILYYNPMKNCFTNPTLFEILTLKQPVFIIDVDIRLRPLNKLPLKERKLQKWLENEWIEKDRILEAMQKQLKLNVD